MVSVKNKSVFISGLILVLAFLIESPLRPYIVSLFSFAPPLSNILTFIAVYVAILICLMINTKKNVGVNKFLKGLVSVFLFALVDNILPMFLHSGLIGAFYQILRPVIAVLFICFSAKWITGCRIQNNKILWISDCAVFIISTVCNIIEYFRTEAVLKNLDGDLNSVFEYIEVLSSNYSVYDMLICLCFYVLLFTAFFRVKNSSR